MVVAKIDADRIPREDDKIPRHQGLFTRIILGRPRSSDGGHVTGPRIVSTDPMSLGVRDVHHIVNIERDGSRVGQVDFQSRSIAVESPLPRSDYGGDDAGLVIDLPNPVASRVADVEIIARVNRHPQRKVQTRLSAW